MADADLLDEIKSGFGLKNDSELAGFLRVTRATIHNCRFEGDRRLGKKARFFVLDHIAFLRTRNKSGQWIEAVGAESLANKLVAFSKGMAKQKALKHIPTDASEIAEKELIDVAKDALECETDDELAAILGIARNTVSAVRSGKTTLGLDPRLEILNRIEPFDIERVKAALETTDDLIEAVHEWAVKQKASGAADVPQ